VSFAQRDLFLAIIFSGQITKGGAKKCELSIPLGYAADHVPHHPIEGIVDLVVRFGTGIRECGPTYSGRRSHHERGRTWKAAVMP
jgi:hypothetical protein